jgi:hypothetical protein
MTMHETFKNVSIFIMFVCSIFLWNAAKVGLSRHFRFDYGEQVLLVLWATGIVVLFHLLYYYFGKGPEKVTYICSGFSALLIGGLLHYNVIPSSF